METKVAERAETMMISSSTSSNLEDAFCHFPVRKEELRHCVTPDEHDQERWYGQPRCSATKCAPLIVGRLSSALGRLLQSLLSPEETQLQVYVDDVLIAALGAERSERSD